MKKDLFGEQYKALNKEQKRAVDTIEGPVMVIAGPGTGKTQVLALRIANILKETDTPPDGILCLTFTNSGVKAMRERLVKLVGPVSSRVKITTFHSFGGALIEEFYEALSLKVPPTLLDERDSVLLADEILEEGEWEFLRPRSGGAQNYQDLKSLTSLLRRERISASEFRKEIEKEKRNIAEDPENISSRGRSKGELKKEAQEKIVRLERTAEAALFYEVFEKTKRERNLADYDDVLEFMLSLAESSTEVGDNLRERHLYVLVDEHQDSSGVQNEFLAKVWGDIEKPNLFVVGDDRQLIYGFSGASLGHFESFAETFRGTETIPLVENYRSTQTILDFAEALLGSTLTKDKLRSQSKEKNKIKLIEAEYPRDEILAAGIAIKDAIQRGLSPNDCALLVPKNAQVRSAMAVLSDLGLPVAAGNKARFLGLPETKSLVRVLRAVANPFDSVSLAEIIMDERMGVPALLGHRFLKDLGHKLSIESFEKGGKEIKEVGRLLRHCVTECGVRGVYGLIQSVADTFLFQRSKDHDKLLKEIEVVRTMLHIVLSRLEKKPNLNLSEFINFLDRLEEYHEDIPLAVFSSDEGVRVMTLHASKGLEFDFVWVAHLDEGSLMKGRRIGFVLPERITALTSKKDELTARRELYVALTRAKRFCTLSFSCKTYTGTDQMLAHIVAELPEGMMERQTSAETEAVIMKHNPKAYVASHPIGKKNDVLVEIKYFVKEEYSDLKVSVTHLNNFFSCPWKWYFRSFLRLPEAESEYLQFGNLVHSAIEIILKERADFNGDLGLPIEATLDDMHITDTNTRARFRKDAIKVLTHFIEDELPQIDEHARAEKSLNYRDPEFPHLYITGKIDLVEELGEGSLRVSDFKTGKPKSAHEVEKRTEEGRMSDLLRQLAMYSYLLQHQKQEFTVDSSRLMFLEAGSNSKDALYETKITNTEVALLQKDISDYDALLASGEWVDRPCDFKPHGDEKECKYCKLRDNLLSN